MRLHFLTNGIFSTSSAGGDIHFLKLAEGAARQGYELNFFGGHALQEVIRKHQVPGTVTLTDSGMMAKTDTGVIGGQVKLFRDMHARYRRTMAALDTIGPDDSVALALERMSDAGYRHLPVVDGTRLVGIVSIRDLHRSVKDQMEADIILLAESLVQG